MSALEMFFDDMKSTFSWASHERSKAKMSKKDIKGLESVIIKQPKQRDALTLEEKGINV